MRRASLDEDWSVGDALEGGWRFGPVNGDREAQLRDAYRQARAVRVGRMMNGDMRPYSLKDHLAIFGWKDAAAEDRNG